MHGVKNMDLCNIRFKMELLFQDILDIKANEINRFLESCLKVFR